MRRLLASLCLVAALFGPAHAQAPMSAPQPAPMPPAIATPRDVAYPGGTLKLDIDATDLDRKIWRIRQSIPIAKGGEVVLHYPQWIPGNHAPRGPIYNFAGLTISANGKRLAWRRDPVDVFAFHVSAPTDARALDIEAQFLTPIESAQGPTMVTPDMLRVNWYVAALYPAGYFARRVNIDAIIRLPKGWSYATALETASSADGVVSFKTVSFETLMDSPLIAGRYLKKWDLDPGGRSRVTLNVVADEAELLEPSDAALQVHRNLVLQADKLFGARHFDHYDFLLSASSQLATMGVEHQRSSDNGTMANYFKTWDTAFISRDLLPHEYTHSWNGKYRRPADLWTPTYNVPMRDSLLWVYEGQTQYWGVVLAARSGFLTKDQALESLASTAATYQTRIGRDWRPLIDTTSDPIIAARRSLPWGTWQRSEDYYSEGLLIWLDADTLIREVSGGKKSLDDFAKSFFGMNDGDWGQLTYQLKDVADTLGRVQANDWMAFLHARVDEVAPKAPLDGLERGGYRLTYDKTPGQLWREQESRARVTNLMYSAGFSVNASGKIQAVQWDGPAFKAGLTTAATINAVNGLAFSPERLKASVGLTDRGGVLELVVKQDDSVRTVRLDYRGGHRYPKLERIPGKPALLDQILAPR